MNEPRDYPDEHTEDFLEWCEDERISPNHPVARMAYAAALNDRKAALEEWAREESPA